MGKADFLALNEAGEGGGQRALRQSAQHGGRLAAPEKDASITASRPLRFFAYAWGQMSEMPADTESGMVRWLGKAGFHTNPILKIAKSAEELLKVHEEIGLARGKLELRHRTASSTKSTGSTGRSGWASSHETRAGRSRTNSPAEQATTVVRDIEIQVGPTRRTHAGCETGAGPRRRRDRAESDAAQCRRAIPASDIAEAGSAQVTAVNPGGDPSNALTFQINALSVSPATIPAGGTVTVAWSGLATPTARDWIAPLCPGRGRYVIPGLDLCKLLPNTRHSPGFRLLSLYCTGLSSLGQL